ncbi:hypothetical protein ACRARG_14575 [Pseudooceanicola sp. C21-150M6]|uniref:hypothetical protein n=1 Tax=Pseudooceanicola sp. C21-150M6 TaxID=3434355 RepID=UPI003D7F7C6E
MLDLSAGSSHLYPGARLRVISGDGSDAVIRFADGTSARAEVSGDRLAVEAHVTGAGTRIGAKVWRLTPEDDGYRVKAREV